MKELQKEFIGVGVMRGFVFKQLMNSVQLVNEKRSGRYLYSVISPMGAVYYEVFDHKENTPYDLVSYPGVHSFGRRAKCCTSYDRAMRYFTDGFE